MNVVVTGATSFIGAVTVGQLLRQGCRVCAVVRPGSKNLGHLWEYVPEDGKERLRVVPLHMEQIEELGRILGRPGHIAEPEDSSVSSTDGRGRSADGSVSSADDSVSSADSSCKATDASSGDGSGWDAWVQIGWDGAGSDNRMKRGVQQANVRNSLAAVRAASGLGCGRFLFTGSQAEYGIHHSIITEDTPCNPVSEYGKAKADFANLAKELCKSRKMEYIHTRIFSVYGPGDHPWSLVHTCLNTWMQGGHMELGECTQKWNFLYIEDAAAAIIRLLTEGRPGVYNIAGEDTRILREFIEEMYCLCGSRGSYAYGKRKPNAEGPASLIPDISKLEAETGWRPVTSFTEGIYETMHSLRENASR